MFATDEISRLNQTLKERLFQPELWRSSEGRLFDIQQVCWIETAGRGLSLTLEDATTVTLPSGDLGPLQADLAGRHVNFQRTHNSALANLARVRSVERTAAGSYLLHFDAGISPAPVSSTYAEAVAVALGAGHTLDELTPALPAGVDIKQLGLINLGEEEAQAIPPGNPQAAEAWREKWWIENFEKDQMFLYFREKTTNELDKTRIIRNAIWQRFCSIRWGLWEPDYGDVRGIYYHPVEDILARNNLLSEGTHKADPNTVSALLREMVVDYKLFRYADFCFPDPHPNLRGIGKVNPHLIVFAEKKDFIKVLQQLAEPYGATYCAVTGEPSTHSMEIFAGMLRAAFDVDKTPIHIFGITDLNPGGTSIGESIVEDLLANSIPHVHYHTMVSADMYEPYQIKYFIKELAKFRLAPGHDPEPVGNTTASYITKAERWFKTVLKSDRRFRRERKTADGKVEVTLFGLQSNTLKPAKIRERFEKEIQPFLSPDRPPDPVGVAALAAALPRRRWPRSAPFSPRNASNLPTEPTSLEAADEKIPGMP